MTISGKVLPSHPGLRFPGRGDLYRI